MMVCFMTWMMICLISKVKEVSENPKVSDLTFCNCPGSYSSRPLDKSAKDSFVQEKPRPQTQARF